MKALNSEQILELFENSTPFPQLYLRKHASVRQLLLALERSPNPHVRQVLCDVLGFRHAKSAVPLLIRQLDDPASGVRCAAADALGKVGKLTTGAALLHQYERETDLSVKRTLAVALGAVRCTPAVAVLRASLDDQDASLRGCAAWSLGMLRAESALESLERALHRETDPYPRVQMAQAVAAIRGD